MINEIDYEELFNRLKDMLYEAKQLGLVIQPKGGYAMGFNKNNLPIYPVGLFGALSIVKGQGARNTLGLTFEQTMSLEQGFNGPSITSFNKKKCKHPQLERIGKRLSAESVVTPFVIKRKSAQPDSDFELPAGIVYGSDEPSAPSDEGN